MFTEKKDGGRRWKAVEKRAGKLSKVATQFSSWKVFGGKGVKEGC